MLLSSAFDDFDKNPAIGARDRIIFEMQLAELIRCCCQVIDVGQVTGIELFQGWQVDQASRS